VIANNKKSVATEISWLALCILITLILCRFCLRWDIKHNDFSIYFHDTIFVIPAVHIILSLFLFLSFLIYFTRLIRNRFSKNISIAIALMDGLALIIILAFVIKNLYTNSLELSGWTAYPPLSSSAESNLKIALDPTDKVLIYILFALQIIVTIALVYISYNWGKNIFKNKIQS
jgi:heme/copper-type cytochrome/quinol oxidase subunit 1